MIVHLNTYRRLSYSDILKYYPELDYYDLVKIKEGEGYQGVMGIDLNSMEELSKFVKDMDRDFILDTEENDNNILLLTIDDDMFDYETGDY